MNERKLELRSTSTATTYTFRAEAGFGWACCSVNDSTGELNITSDFGNWSHRWDASPRSLGHATLTDFIGTRADVDYMARKLAPRSRAERFSAEKTTAELRRMIIERRREAEQYMHKRKGHLDRETARQLWDDLGNLEDDCGDSVDLYLERMPQEVYTFVTDEPFRHIETEQTAEDRALRELVLPALIEACRGTVAQRAAAAPAEATTRIATEVSELAKERDAATLEAEGLKSTAQESLAAWQDESRENRDLRAKVAAMEVVVNSVIEWSRSDAGSIGAILDAAAAYRATLAARPDGDGEGG